jgi:hypothetical protein
MIGMKHRNENAVEVEPCHEKSIDYFARAPCIYLLARRCSFGCYLIWTTKIESYLPETFIRLSAAASKPLHISAHVMSPDRVLFFRS